MKSGGPEPRGAASSAASMARTRPVSYRLPALADRQRRRGEETVSPPWAGSPFKSQVPPRSASENPNSRQGHEPVLQGRVTMEHGPSPPPAFVGIDVSKDRLDVHVRPTNSALSF